MNSRVINDTFYLDSHYELSGEEISSLKNFKTARFSGGEKEILSQFNFQELSDFDKREFKSFIKKNFEATIMGKLSKLPKIAANSLSDLKKYFATKDEKKKFNFDDEKEIINFMQIGKKFNPDEEEIINVIGSAVEDKYPYKENKTLYVVVLIMILLSIGFGMMTIMTALEIQVAKKEKEEK